MDCKIATLECTGTWATVPRPPGKNIIGLKWVFRIKHNTDGSVEKYKARLVARGFTQVFSEDYYDTFSPVAKLSSFRTILALAVCHDWDIESFDFNSAYLNGKLGEDEEIYMQLPPRYEGQGEDMVKRLQKSLYGLKQAGRKWYDALTHALIDLGFCVTHADLGVFYKRTERHILILVVHVDDCIFTGSSPELIAKYKKKFDAHYKLTDLGPVSWLLGIKITRNCAKCTISLSQTTYIESILKRFTLSNAKPYATPIMPGVIYSRGNSPSAPIKADRMRKVPYREAIGSLMYASVTTQPNITYAVLTLSQFLDNPGNAHWEAVKRIFRYLSGTRSLELTFGSECHDLVGYSDADGTMQDHWHAISRHVFLIDGGAISWSSRKQELVTLSTAEAKYVATMHAAKEALWLRRLIHEIFPSLARPTPLHCDSQSVLKLIKDNNYQARTKHIDICYHFIRQVAQTKVLELIYCPTDNMTADILTKALPKWKVSYHISSLGLHIVTHEGEWRISVCQSRDSHRKSDQ
jgi:Reverse transcriptase (RNA-dependent DNA polymerase)